ncbi:MAG: hypothetical protein K2X87_17930 [Gemmataceae bacterium]|nr:hypothetical protein [Gemmataceae bacterium]
MKAKADYGRLSRAARRGYRESSGCATANEADAVVRDQPESCEVVAVGKRRDGRTRYWCLRHRADATAKYGKPAPACRAAHIPPVRAEDVFELDIDRYKGGVALWGAVPAVYDTTSLPMDRGIHVHARVTAGAEKEVDRTVPAVRILSRRLPQDGIVVSELDAIYYMVTSVFGFKMKHVRCSYCGFPHLDKDWFSVRPHRRHLCAGCGKHFTDTEHAIGNPIVAAREACGVGEHRTSPSKKTLAIRQADFPGGIQVWGSNPAFLWTKRRAEEGGIHVHAYKKTTVRPELDDTYGQVSIDGIDLDPVMVRVLMAQSVLPSLKNRVRSMECPSCRLPIFIGGEGAFTPSSTHTCPRCGRQVAATGRFRKTVANPLPAILARIAQQAPRRPQAHDIGLMPETLYRP